MFSLLQVKFFILYIYILINYTNKYMKVLYLQIKKSGVAGNGDGSWRLRITGGLETRCLEPQVHFFQLFVIARCSLIDR